MSERKSYKTDLSDEQWALVEPVIIAWKGAYPSVSGHQGRYAMREIVNALLYQGRTGCQWDLHPARRQGPEGAPPVADDGCSSLDVMGHRDISPSLSGSPTRPWS
ncbi:transposase [Streptomyces sp. CJ_13]|uniref:transposase n=1 Tax=Streptomyces sp. CJ_13 TaxID=2724943 RepID=UPI0035B03888